VLVHTAAGGTRPRTPAAPQLARYSAELRCPIRDGTAAAARRTVPQTFRPMRTWLKGQTSPEMLYLETKLASLIPFARATDLLKEVLPLGDLVNAETVRNHLQLTAERSSRSWVKSANSISSRARNRSGKNSLYPMVQSRWVSTAVTFARRTSRDG
jgi:hypothetical protein